PRTRQSVAVMPSIIWSSRISNWPSRTVSLWKVSAIDGSSSWICWLWERRRTSTTVGWLGFLPYSNAGGTHAQNRHGCSISLVGAGGGGGRAPRCLRRRQEEIGGHRYRTQPGQRPG